MNVYSFTFNVLNIWKNIYLCVFSFQGDRNMVILQVKANPENSLKNIIVQRPLLEKTDDANQI